MTFLINLTDLFNYAGEGSRKYIEGENVVNAHHLMYNGITGDDEEKTSLIFLCLKSSDLYVQ